MTPAELKARLTAFAVAVVKFCRELRKKPEARSIADQLSDSATSMASNYRACCRARSRREFISKIAVAVEEADETEGWLIVILDAELWDRPVTESLLKEGRELLAILAASRRTAEAGQRALNHK